MNAILSPRRDHYLATLSVFLITVALIAGMVGCGPPSQNLEIGDWYDLNAIRDNLRGHHRLMNDLDSTTAGYQELASPTANEGKGWQPIGTWDNHFTGTFDGHGHEIRDLFINRPDATGVGLFGYVGKGGDIKNLAVVNANVTGKDCVGGLVGHNEGTVSSSNSTGSVTGGENVGGLVGHSDGTVSNCYCTGSVTGEDHVGGLVGENDDTVKESNSTGSVTGGGKIGGLVGKSWGTVSNSYSTGSVTGEWEVGGLVGENDGSVRRSFWDTETSGQATSDGGTGKTTAEMQSITTFSEWDITGVGNLGERDHDYIWNIVDEETYPFLSWQ